MRHARRRHESGHDGRAAAGRAAAGRKALIGCASLLALALAAAGCGSNSLQRAGDTAVSGGIATLALPANVTPNYIFPFTPGIDYTIANLDNLQYLMYRPLYWFGDNGLPYLNEERSLAYTPVYSGQTVTIKLKPYYHWSNGTAVNAKDIMFWMNMMAEEADPNFGGFVPGGIPGNITDVHAVGTYEVQMTIIGKYSQPWFTDNELSQITPLPLYWDRSGASTMSDCADIPADCPAVYNYLNSIAGNSSDWAGSAIWRVVDGPWHLFSYSSQGQLTFTYNTSYSGPVPRNHISEFVEIPFTSEEAEFNVLQAGGSSAIDVGYLPTVDAPVPPPGEAVGQNPVPGYDLQPLYTWGLSYIPYNFSKADPQVAIFRQLYFRRAFQYLVNQEEIIQGALHGYGKISTGPVGDTPPTAYLSKAARAGDPFPYNLALAESLLTSHGWHVNKIGVTTCIDPTECGAGIKLGAKLSLTMLYATGNAWVEAAVLQLKSNASLVGIQLNLTGESFDQVVNTAQNGCGTPTVPKLCVWELADWGQGWSYQPDYLPTGDELFEGGSGGNLGDYNNSKDNQLIKATLQAATLPEFKQAMYTWENFLTPQLPVILQPEAPFALIESIDTLHIGIQSPTLVITPEDWYFVK
jgi:peptide/nickel transport system substrate-binding protein